MKKNKSVWIMGLVFLAGLLVLLYPVFSNIIAQQTSNTEIDTYNAAVSNFTDEQSEEALKEAAEYNKSLAGSAISDPFSSSTTDGSEQYNSLLNMSHGIMAYVEIPSINVYLPIYHGTDDTVLEKVQAIFMVHLFLSAERARTLLSQVILDFPEKSCLTT